MDTTKQNPTPQAQESDDLIAELARLVAQDARSQSVNSAVYTQPEPESQAYQEPYSEPEAQYEREPEVPVAYAETPEPSLGYDEGSQQLASAYDFGLTESQTAEPDSYQAPRQGDNYDVIADLIASAEHDVYAPEQESPEDDTFADQPAQHDFADFRSPYAAEPHFEPPDRVTNEPFANDFAVQAYSDEETRARGDERDPLSEIEALIGEAARVSVDAEGAGGRKVRSSFLDTSDYQDIKADRAVDAAESAILAAAAASGARVSSGQHFEDTRDEPDLSAVYADEQALSEPAFDGSELAGYSSVDEEEPVVERRQRERGLGGYILPAVAGTAIVAALAGGYFLFLAPDPVPSEAPVLTAAGGEIKEVPEITSTPTTASESVIFNEIDGNTVPPENEALVSRDQTNGATGAEVGGVLAPEEGEVGLANRPVRTVTVRPDGTIVSSDNSVAGSNILPVERPDVPAVPNSSLTSDPIGEAIAAAIADEPVAATVTPTGIAASPVPTGIALAPTPAPAVENPIIDPANVPRPVARPAGLSVPQASQPALQQPTQIAAAPTQPAVTQAAPVTPGNVGAWVQLSSQRSEEAARAGIPALQSRYGALFNNTALDVSQVDLGDRGIYYRVRLPQPTMADATNVCNAIKAQGGDCFVLNN